MDYLYINNWCEWQSYRKDRGTPPWIKVHRTLLSNQKWAALSDAEKGQLISIWIVAADAGGKIPANPTVIKKICQLDNEPNINKFKDLQFLITTCQPNDNQMTTTCQPLDAPETETETEVYSKEIETDKKEREALTKFSDLELPEEGKKFAEENGVTGEHLKKCWQKFKITKDKCTLDDWFKHWKNWVLDEKKPPEVKSNDNALIGEELLMQQLGAIVWRKKRDMTIVPAQIRLLTEWEAKNGKVTWENVREWREQNNK